MVDGGSGGVELRRGGRWRRIVAVDPECNMDILLRFATLVKLLTLPVDMQLVPGSKNEVNSTINDQAQPVPSPRSVFVRRNK
ncbi:uncharacterized protein A4U43_C07F17660 [Asparagus officinalis]|uniref:Uncharacterized protein n=1 Tax=Asparagus officinalis TaxID=4686 RepID=A0A5P1ECR9_ASPOF|nr:uncharacterized protein A4U43_C07F17660 [Asparagus officinalis]